jgi:hypothetical protein
LNKNLGFITFFERSKKRLITLNNIKYEKDWSYLEVVMKKMNFPTLWLKWIMECITTASASVLVNCCPTDEFRGCIGLGF